MSLRVVDSLQSIPAAEWDALAPANFPFADHAYLNALETSGCVGTAAGWQPLYLTSWQGKELRGALYAYFKDNSYGEYIFDWAWARAYHEHGIPYYPKLVAAVPFTPATGTKLLVSPGLDAAEMAAVRDELLGGALGVAKQAGASSSHFLFTQADELPAFEKRGLLTRHSYQYHWRNRDYRSFDDFLGALKARKRKQIRQEREQVRQAGIEIEIVEGAALSAERAAQFYPFYVSTIEKMGAIAYLTPEFFPTVFETLSRSVILMFARRAGNSEPLAAALYYQKGDALFGRYWGCTEDVPGLHFELCYYQGIELAIARRLRLFEAGAQGEHKIARGFLPEVTRSAHWIEHPSFRTAIAAYIEQEKTGIAELFRGYALHSPYREESLPPPTSNSNFA